MIEIDDNEAGLVTASTSGTHFAERRLDSTRTLARTIARSVVTALRCGLTWNCRHLGNLSRRLSMFVFAKHIDRGPVPGPSLDWSQLDPCARL